MRLRIVAVEPGLLLRLNSFVGYVGPVGIHFGQSWRVMQVRQREHGEIVHVVCFYEIMFFQQPIASFHRFSDDDVAVDAVIAASSVFRHPPTAVPNPIVAAHKTITQFRAANQGPNRQEEGRA